MARGGSLPKPAKLTYDQRAQIFDKTAAKVKKQYFDPNYNGTEWPKHADARRESVLALADPDEFELAMHDLVRSLKTSHTGFFHQSVRRVPGRLAIGASFRRAEFSAGPRWVAQDVHQGGPGEVAGLKPLDVLRSINGKPAVPPEQPMFPMGAEATLSVDRNGTELDIKVTIPV